MKIWLRTTGLIVLLLTLSGCNWQAVFGIRKDPPPPLPLGAVADPATDPLVKLERQVGAPVERLAGPLLNAGRQVVFYRYRKGAQCGRGMVAYNPNRTVQSITQGTGNCPVSVTLEPPEGAIAGDQPLMFGFVNDPNIARIDVILANGQLQHAIISGTIYYVVMQPDPSGRPQMQNSLGVVGYDAQGQEVYRYPAK